MRDACVARLISSLLPVCFFVVQVYAESSVILTGAGATFPYPLYQSWFEEYEKQTGVRVTYRPVGSGKGIEKFLSGEVDFGATDAFLSDAQIRESGRTVLHIPTCVGAVVLTYNLPGNPQLQLSGELIADIFLGKVTKWNDRQILRINPTIKLPDREIVPIYRSDASGTSYIFTDYLQKTSGRWRNEIGKGTKVRWPKGIGVEGNPGVSSFVQRVEGSLGYVELTYAETNQLPTALIRNRAGQFTKASPTTVSAAAEVDLPMDTRILLTHTSSSKGYPISAFSYILVFANQDCEKETREKAESLARFLWWATHGGQSITSRSLYAPLPPVAVARAETIIPSITHCGKQIDLPE